MSLPVKSRELTLQLTRSFLIALACAAALMVSAHRPVCAQTAPADRAWEEMVAAEELIHALGPALGALARAVEHGGLPDQTTVSLFEPAVAVRDLAAPTAELRMGKRAVWRYTVEARAELVTVAREEVHLWAAELAKVAAFDHAGFRVKTGSFVPGSRDRFDVELLFDGRATKSNGRTASLHGVVAVRWRRSKTAEVDGAEWRIERWESRSLEVDEAAQALFAEALDDAVPDRATRERLRRSRHEELALAKLRAPETFRPPHRHFFVGSQDRHPGVAVADVDGDGLDDIYVMARWGANQLLRARGDGTFVEEGARRGLDLADHSAAAIFADFDNDGDADLFLGRTMAGSRYLENRNGRFVDRSDLFPAGTLPALVSSVNAVDVDNDGLLDIYVSTYAAQMVVFDLKVYQARNPGAVAPPRLLEEYLPPAAAEELSRKIRTKGAHLYKALPGPPNVLFLNRGDRFEPSGDRLVGAYRNTYQATWADYDRDGDADVYLAHDFSPNQLLRNDGAGRFTDVTAATGTADIGFGMGVTWGDYDRDGRQDLYVSNMYSKAGRRVTSYFDGIGEDFAKMARGNTLFRNRGDRFDHVSGLEAPKLEVEAAGWSWSGQFADFDNDAHLDLYVASGYYTAPRDVAVAVDT